MASFFHVYFPNHHTPTTTLLHPETTLDISCVDDDGYDIDVEMGGYDAEVGALIVEMVVKNRMDTVSLMSQGTPCATLEIEAMEIQMMDITGREIGEFEISEGEERDMINAVEIAECVAEFRAEERAKRAREEEDEIREEVETAATYFDMVANDNPDVREWIRASNERMEKDMDAPSNQKRKDRTVAAGKRRTVYSVATGMLASIHANSSELRLRIKEKRRIEEEGRRGREDKRRAEELMREGAVTIV